MRVRYSKLVGIACLVAGIVFGCLALLSDNLSFVGALTPIAFLTHESVRRRLRGVTGWLAIGQDWAAFRAWGERRARSR